MPDPDHSATPISLFYSYSHKDEALRQMLGKHLSVLKDDGIIRDWHDRRIEAGTEWDGVINENLDKAGIILLLISADFMASRYCRDVDVSRAMERHEAGTARVIPVILRPAVWHTAPFGKLQALPQDGKAITVWPNRDRGFVDVVRGIREAAESLLLRPASSSAADQAFANLSPTAHERPRAMDKTRPPLVVEPPDQILVKVLEALPGRPISGERLVRPDGTISLGFYGDVHVAGLTLLEIKEKLVVHLTKFISDETLGLVEIDPETLEPVVDPATGKPILKDPKLSERIFVDITTYASQKYYVLGHVYRPGRLPYTGGDTVLDALQLAGGVLPSADFESIRLIRSYPEGSPAQSLPVDYEGITMGADMSTNYQIFPRDRLVVSPNPKYGPGGNQSSY